MVEGWLIYHRTDYENNRWFADRLARQVAEYGLSIRPIMAGEADMAGVTPAFAVNRSRDWRFAQALEQRGCRVFNSSEVARVGNDKVESHALAARLGLGQVEMAVLDNRPECLAAQPFGYPIVLKNPYGHGGGEVFLARDGGELQAQAARMGCARVLLQKLCGRPGVDVRVYVMGGSILCAVRRSAAEGFRANLSLGGSASYYELNAAERELAGRVIDALRPDYAGVDFILDADGGFLFNEIEDVVGARALYQLGGIDPAELLARHIAATLL